MKILSKIRKVRKVTLRLILLFAFIIAVWQLHKPLPDGLSYKGQAIPVDDGQLDFLYDLTYLDENGELVHDQEIFDEIISSIEDAQSYILLDMFLFNSWLGKADSSFRSIAQDVTAALIEKKEKSPRIKIEVITDPINTVYGGDQSLVIMAMREAGIHVYVTDLKPLRDSNPIYSSFWRMLLQWFGNDTWPQWVRHPFSETENKISLRSYLTLLNFKANHRKTFLADSGETFVSIVSSANPHDSSSAHSNVAIKITGGSFAQELWESERAVVKMSNSDLYNFPQKDSSKRIATTTVQLLTEGKIKKSLIDIIDDTKKDDEINIAMFYLSNRDVVSSLVNATRRRVAINLIMDPNKDAFGYEKNGIPNRQVATELLKRSNGRIRVRWYETNGEQFHSKITYIKFSNDDRVIVLGSANLTRRNIDDYNLESDVLIRTKKGSSIDAEVDEYYEALWSNSKNNVYTTGYSSYKDESVWKMLLYRLEEMTGLSSF